LAKVVISQTESTLITVNVLADTPGDVTVAISGFLASYISPSLFKNSSMYTLECQIIKNTPLKMPCSCMTQHNVKNKCKDVKQLRSQCNKPNTCQAFKQLRQSTFSLSQYSVISFEKDPLLTSLFM